MNIFIDDDFQFERIQSDATQMHRETINQIYQQVRKEVLGYN
jgi:hypothetical protein